MVTTNQKSVMDKPKMNSTELKHITIENQLATTKDSKKTKKKKRWLNSQKTINNMVVVNRCLLIVTLSTNGLHSSTEGHRVVYWIKTKGGPTMLSKRNSHNL